jgi:rhodanese-related sulfurtransferase
LTKAWWKFGGPRLATAAVVLSFGLSRVLAQDAPMQIEGAKTLDSKGVIELISTTPDVVIIDNRTKADFDSGHIEGAVNIVDTSMTAESAFAGVVKSKALPVLFYCNGVKCGRAAKARPRDRAPDSNHGRQDRQRRLAGGTTAAHACILTYF